MSARAAEPAGDNAGEQVLTEDLKALEDPTILLRRVWMETEWNKFRDGSNSLEETLGGAWAWRVSASQEWAVRLKLPYDWHLAGDSTGDSNEHGLGDIKVGTATAFRLNDAWRAGGGLELRMPTAEDDLGDDVWRLQGNASVAWDATRWLTFPPATEYNQSIAEEHGAAPQHYLEMFFPATVLLPRYWSVTPRYEAKVDFENHNYVTQSGKLSVAKQLEDPQLGFVLSIKEPFNTGNKEFQVNFSITYYFQSP
ncbi:MAG: hypothetical protein HYR72_18505 [Deltaproteobacteria bacterium]|nr:hypothetical protein [Deltaproteobacteria bacterium]MBI3386287.1 hypothetical protein [Deltaproteobacteria bacterium]